MARVLLDRHTGFPPVAGRLPCDVDGCGLCKGHTCAACNRELATAITFSIDKWAYLSTSTPRRRRCLNFWPAVVQLVLAFPEAGQEWLFLHHFKSQAGFCAGHTSAAFNRRQPAAKFQLPTARAVVVISISARVCAAPACISRGWTGAVHPWQLQVLPGAHVLGGTGCWVSAGCGASRCMGVSPVRLPDAVPSAAWAKGTPPIPLSLQAWRVLRHRHLLLKPATSHNW